MASGDDPDTRGPGCRGAWAGKAFAALLCPGPSPAIACRQHALSPGQNHPMGIVIAAGPTHRGRCDRGAQRPAESPFGRLAAADMTRPPTLTSAAGTDPAPSRPIPERALSFPAPPIASGRGGRPRIAQSWNQSAGYRSGSPRGSHLRYSSVRWAVTRAGRRVPAEPGGRVDPSQRVSVQSARTGGFSSRADRATCAGAAGFSCQEGT
jgi:hypothetical protein